MRDYIDKTTGIQTLVQMTGLVEMVARVRRGARRPRCWTRRATRPSTTTSCSPWCGRRLAKLERGELSVEDYTLKGALAAARRRSPRRGWSCTSPAAPTSTTCAAEAEALGFARLFEGRIHGSIGDVKHEAKRVVLERILAEIGPKGLAGLVTFGDGPVEMRETRRRGGYCVGVASDEVRRFGGEHGRSARA